MPIFKFRNLDSGQATPIPDGEFSIGRNDDAYVHVEDSMVSRRHAKLFNSEDGLFIEDLGSGNGTVVGGVLITSRSKLEVGDLVQFGPVVFRVDPEVPGEVSAEPSAGSRQSNRAYMRKDTERLPVAGDPPRVVAPIATENLAAPQVSVTDAESEELNAIVITEPTAPDPLRLLPSLQPGTAPEPPHPASKPMVSSFNPPKPKQEPSALRSATSPAPENRPPVSPEENAVYRKALSLPDDSARPSTSWGWAILYFLAGLGVGLFLGLVFAKLFIEMGGKVASLP